MSGERKSGTEIERKGRKKVQRETEKIGKREGKEEL